MSADSFQSKSTFSVGNKKYTYFDINKAAAHAGVDISKLPISMKVLLENLLRFEDGETVCKDDIMQLFKWLDQGDNKHEINYRPARVLMQDFTGVPAVVDLAAMRDAVAKLGGDPAKINPLVPVDMVIDHSVQVDKYGNPSALEQNTKLEMERNYERYEFLKWGQQAFDNFRVVPPGTGICHQVNLEYLARVVWTKKQDSGEEWAFPDTLVGTDSHTTMINGLAVLGWGVGGIEAESVMLGQPISMLLPEVIGFKLTGQLKEGTTATDLVLTITHMLRKKGVVGKFVEFYGEGLLNLSLANRATIANMAPEYGATCGFFPVDEEALKYLKLSGRDDHIVEMVDKYTSLQNMQRQDDLKFTESLELDISVVEPVIAGPKRPQDKIALSDSKTSALSFLTDNGVNEIKRYAKVSNKEYQMSHGDVVIAAITSCTNTSNPSVMVAAGLVAKKAVELGLKSKPWVKTSLAPGSTVVTEYLNAGKLTRHLDALGFNVVGYGCTTCIGNSGPLNKDIEETIQGHNLNVAAVLSGNRNFEGRVHPLVKMNYLASPPLVVVYALAGTMNIDLFSEPIGQDANGNDVFIKDVWPSSDEVEEYIGKNIDSSIFLKEYANVFEGDDEWKAIKIKPGKTYQWTDSTYINNPPYFHNISANNKDLDNFSIKNAAIVGLLGDSVTTDHISPAGSIAEKSPAAKFLQDNGISIKDFNSYGSRRGNHEVMMRGTFANIRIHNEMADGVEGGYTKYLPSGEIMPIYDAAMSYQQDKVPLVIIAGGEYGTGSSRDWAAKGTVLLGIKAVIAESFERIHRSNLVGMGVFPLMFTGSDNRKTLKLSGSETISIDIPSDLKPKQEVKMTVTYSDGKSKEVHVLCRIDTSNELSYFKKGGILHNVIYSLIK